MKKYLTALLFASVWAEEEVSEEEEIACNDDYLEERGGQVGLYPVWGSRSIYNDYSIWHLGPASRTDQCNATVYYKRVFELNEIDNSFINPIVEDTKFVIYNIADYLDLENMGSQESAQVLADKAIS